MANRHDKPLPEIELPRYLASETLALILHTIILLRAPKTLGNEISHRHPQNLLLPLTPPRPSKPTNPFPPAVGVDIIEYRPSNLSGVYQKLKFPSVTKLIDLLLDHFFSSSLIPIGPDLCKGCLSVEFHVSETLISYGKRERRRRCIDSRRVSTSSSQNLHILERADRSSLDAHPPSTFRHIKF